MGKVTYTEGAQRLCADIMHDAYRELVDLLLAGAALQFHDKSYNCSVLYDRIMKGDKYGKNFEMKEYIIRRQTELLQEWLIYSPLCNYTFLHKAKGATLINRAMEIAAAFIRDEIMQNATHILLDTDYAKYKDKNNITMQKWTKARNAWRAERGLVEVNEGDKNESTLFI